MPDFRDTRIWRKGCNYLVAAEGDICYKCGQPHNQTAKEAQAWPFVQNGDGDND